MTTTTGSPRRDPREWTNAQLSLAAGLAGLGAAISVPAFAEIYQTVTHLVWPWFGYWSWTVPVSGEICFLWLWGVGILLAWRGEASGVLRGAALALIIAGSYYLNVYAAHGNAPDAVAHILVVSAFFTVALLAKSAVIRLRAAEGRPGRVTPAEWALHPRRTAQLRSRMALWAEPSKEQALARLAALRYAAAVAQADPRVGRGRGWRRNLPVTLRWQLSEGIIPPAVTDAIAAAGGGASWQEPAAAWITSELALLDARPAAAPAAGGHAQGTPGPAAPPRPAGREPGSGWPSARGVDKAVLARRTAHAAARWAEGHDGARLPATQLPGLLKLRMSRDTAGKLLAAHYAAAGAGRGGLRSLP